MSEYHNYSVIDMQNNFDLLSYCPHLSKGPEIPLVEITLKVAKRCPHNFFNFILISETFNTIIPTINLILSLLFTILSILALDTKLAVLLMYTTM